MRMLPEMEIYNPSDSISTKNICKIVSKVKNQHIRLDKSQQLPFIKRELSIQTLKFLKIKAKIVLYQPVCGLCLKVKDELKD